VGSWIDHPIVFLPNKVKNMKYIAMMCFLTFYIFSFGGMAALICKICEWFFDNEGD